MRGTNADKRKAVKTLLKDEEWSQNSINWIAKECRVSWDLVDRMQSDFKIEKSNERTGKDGRTIDTSNIGNGSEKSKSS